MKRLSISSGRKGAMAIAPRRGTSSRHAGVARRLALTISVLCLGILASSVQGAFAAEITSTGPLTNIGISSDLNCSVNHTGDTAGEFYGGTACGTFVTVGEEHYGPASVPAGYAGKPAYTPVSQTAVTGSGTSGDPYKIVTVVELGSSGLQLTETDSYVVGDESYRTDVQLHNTSASSIEAIVYRAGDCYLQNSDLGFGSVETSTGAVACVSAVEESPEVFVPGSRIEQWFPLSPGSSYYEAGYFEVWNATVSGAAFPNSCRCTEHIDNGGGLSWNVTIPAGGSITRSNLITFSPLGHLPLATTKTADSASASPGGADGYTITISNPNTSAVSLTAITDTLPTGFTYTPGSTTGATTSDPTVSAQTLTWKGPISVPAEAGGKAGTVTLHFGVTVASAPGTYFNNAGGEADEFTIAPTGDTAPVTVTGGPPPDTTLTTSLSGGGKSGATITVDEGTAVTDQATLSGTNAGSATGTVSYKVYSDNECKTEVADAGTVAVTAGSMPPSSPETLAPGKYYWQATYSGDENNKGSQSECGSEVETVVIPTPPCTKVVGSAKVVIRKEGETERQKVENKLSTKLTDKQKLIFTWENGASKLTLTKLTSASCVVGATKKKFTGQGQVTVNGEPGWIATFYFVTTNKQLFTFHIRVSKPKEEPFAFTDKAANLTSEVIS